MSFKRTLALASVLFFAAVAPFAMARAQFVVPELTGPVVDNAGVIDPSTKAQLSQALHDLYESGGSQIEVLTVPSLEGEAIESASIKVVDKWKLGRKKDGTGALLILSAGDHKVRIEVGQGLEGVLPDAIAKRIIDQQMTPLLRSGSVSDAILVGAASIVQVTDPTFDIESALGARRHRQRANDDGSQGPSGGVVLIFLIVIILLGAFGRRGGGGFYMGGGGFGGGFRGGGGGFGGGGWSGGGGGFNGGGASGGW